MGSNACYYLVALLSAAVTAVGRGRKVTLPLVNLSGLPVATAENWMARIPSSVFCD